MDYTTIINKAIVYIEENIESKLTAEDVAKEVGYSYYHFSRIFQDFTGEKIGNYINNRKLSISSKKLISTDKKIVDIALDCGYETYEAFSRAFKNQYNVAPFYYRNNRTEYYLNSREALDINMLKHLGKHVNKVPEIVNIKDIKIAGISYTTTLLNNQLIQFWEEFNEIKKSVFSKEEKQVRNFAICESNNPTYDEFGNVLFTQTLSYEIIAQTPLLPNFLKTQIISGGKYAVFTHSGSIKNMNRSYQFIWGIWYHNTKEVFDQSRKDFEVYDENFLGIDNPKTKVYIYIPIK